VVASDTLIQSADNLVSTTSTTYVKKKEIEIEAAGTYRIEMDIRETRGARSTAFPHRLRSTAMAPRSAANFRKVPPPSPLSVTTFPAGPPVTCWRST
jgi:hypothetical protein